MLPHGPEAEKAQFINNYTKALKESRPITSSEISELVVNLMADPEFTSEDPKITSVVEFVRTSLKNTEIPTGWYIEEIIEREELANHPYEKAFQKLLDLNKIDYTFDHKHDLNQEQIQWLLRMVIMIIIDSGNIKDVDDIGYLELDITENKGNKSIFIELRTKDGKRAKTKMDGNTILNIAKQF